MWWWIILLLITIIVLAISYVALLALNLDKKLAHIPGPKGNFFVGSLGEMIEHQKDISQAYMKWAKQYGPIYKYRVFGRQFIVVSSPEAARKILVDGQDGYRDGHAFGRPLSFYQSYIDIFGLALQNAVGDEWMWRRKALGPGFQARHITNHLLNFVVQKTYELCDELDVTKQAVDVNKRFVKLTLEVICRYLFGREIDFTPINGPQELEHFFDELVHELNEVSRRLPLLPRKETNARKALAQFVGPYVQEIIEQVEAEKQNNSKSNFESLVKEMIKAGYTKQQAIEEVTGLIFAGHDTTAHTMSFACYLLATNPDKKQILLDEIRSVFGGRHLAEEKYPISQAEVSKLNYLPAVIKETLRLFPIAWAVGVGNFKDTEVLGYRIPANTDFNILIREINLDPEIYPEPESFKPERYFSEDGLEEAAIEDGKQKSKNAPPPVFGFSMGAHTCIGKYLAFLEARIILSVLLERYEFVFPSDAKLEVEVVATLRPNAVPIVFQKRS